MRTDFINIIRKILLPLAPAMLVFATAPCLRAQDDNAIESLSIPVETLIESELAPRPHPDLPEPAVVGIVVRDLATGEETVERNADLQLMPASIMKCVTAACALLDNKAGMRYETAAFTRGAVADRQLWGDLVIVASGDPTTDSQYFPTNAGFVDSVAANVVKLGIDSIRGQIIFDSSAVPGGGPLSYWPAADYKWRYGTGHYAINYKDNMLPPDLAMPDPPGKMYQALEEALLADSIFVLDEEIKVSSSPREIYRRYSPTGKEIMRSMMVRSDNMFAEAMLRCLAPGNDMKNAQSRRMKLLKKLGVNTSKVKLLDGSGLSRDNRVTPRFMADMLQKMAASKHSGDYLSLFPKAGEEGTVRRLLAGTPLAGKMILKSGSVRGVQCYAGYKLGDDGKPTHAVVFIVNQFTCPRSEVVSEAEAFFTETFLPKATTDNSLPDNESDNR